MTDPLPQMLSVLCPMHVILDPSGHIRHVGPTLQKLRSDRRLAGHRFLEVFELSRPRALTSMADLYASAGTKLHLQFRDVPRTALKGVLVPIPDGSGAVINLSFGISVLDAVRDYDLTSADFSATDLAIEMLYLVEAKSAAMEASRSLNTRLQGAMIAAEEQAFTDTLTGLKNRRALDHVLDRLLATRHPFSLMHLDLDFFKAVNDTYGHAAGDHVLQQVARIMVHETRDEDTVARIGGDEFVLVFAGLQDRHRIDSIAARLIAGITAPIPFEGRICAISASIGSTICDGKTAIDGARLVADADTALYAAKRAGRGRHYFFDRDASEAVPG